MDKLEKKRAKSVGKSKKIVERAKGWEDVNGDGTKKSKKQIAIEQLEDEEKRKEREWVSDEDMDVEEETAVVEENGKVKGEGKDMDAEISEKVPAPVEVEEML